jgi:hypothetical protein
LAQKTPNPLKTWTLIATIMVRVAALLYMLTLFMYPAGAGVFRGFRLQVSGLRKASALSCLLKASCRSSARQSCVSWSFPSLTEADLPLHVVDRINVSRPRPIAQAHFDQCFLQTLGQGHFDGLFFGSERLDAGVSDEAQLIFRTQRHLCRSRIGCLTCINSRSLEYLLSIGTLGGHIQDHLGFRRSAVRNSVPCLTRYFGLHDHHGKEFAFTWMKGIPQSPDFHGQ